MIYLLLAFAAIGGGFLAWYGGDNWACGGLCLVALALIMTSALSRKIPDHPRVNVSTWALMRARYRMARKKLSALTK